MTENHYTIKKQALTPMYIFRGEWSAVKGRRRKERKNDYEIM